MAFLLQSVKLRLKYQPSDWARDLQPHTNDFSFILQTRDLNSSGPRRPMADGHPPSQPLTDSVTGPGLSSAGDQGRARRSPGPSPAQDATLTSSQRKVHSTHCSCCSALARIFKVERYEDDGDVK